MSRSPASSPVSTQKYRPAGQHHTSRHAVGRIQIRPAPCSEPPYSPIDYAETRPFRALRLIEPPRVDGLGYEIHADQLPFEVDAPAGRPSNDPIFAPQRTPRDDLPCPRQFATRFTQAVVEVMAGRRPVQQLMPMR
ncbi:Rv3235 family protein [Fodinicola feengrottensis]|uniref:Rv3235 family protein n=1 Tax=Fodinicola feengrottensis TaxID=435914 RepID=UPI0013D0E450|nr:Rv3235 family protein [Fodinicola feengrottensis]